MKIIRRQFNKSMTYLVVSNERDQEEFLVDESARVIRDKSDAAIEDIFRPLNEFFQTLTLSAAGDLMSFYESAVGDIMCGDDAPPGAVMISTTVNFVNFCNKHDIFDKLTSFVLFSPLMEQCAVYHDLSYVSIGDDASVEFTRLEGSDAIAIVAITLLCKILFPVWTALKGTRYSDDVDSEIKLVRILESVLEGSKFSIAFEKVRKITNEYCGRIWSQYAVVYGDRNVMNYAQSKVFASLWTKRQINIDLTAKDGNVIVWMLTCIKQSHNSLLGVEMQKKKSVQKLPA